jgi:hypothetical protein
MLWIKVLFAYNIVFTTACLMLFGFVLQGE